jgi:colanic acid/amylovoran biosynthesis protein
MSKNILIYGNGSFYNRGCEAIYQGTIQIFKNRNFNFYVTSKSNRDNKIIDENFHNKIFFPRTINSFLIIFSIILFKLNLPKLALFISLGWLRKIVNKNKIHIALFAGGDNYCYPNSALRFYLINKNLKKLGVKTFFWNASFEEKYIDKFMINDLKSFDGIFVRESSSFKVLADRNLTNIYSSIDPAFFMKFNETNSSNVYIEIKPRSIGINLSTLVVFKDNFVHIIQFIKKLFENFDFIYLFSHVYGEGNFNDDHELNKKIFDSLKDSRVFLIDQDLTSQTLKKIISKFDFVITSRTHASIAAYSQNIMTLVFGYSIKSIGIANDIFGNYHDVSISKEESFNLRIMQSKFTLILKNIISYKDKLRTYNESIKYFYNDNFMEKIFE